MSSSRMFLFEEEVQMRFAILGSGASNLAGTIMRYGGDITNAFNAHFALVDETEDVTQEMQNLPAQLVNKSWIPHSISHGRLLPIYSYARGPGSDPQTTGLEDLGTSSRDLAELIKAVMDLKESVPDSETYEILHRKYPHHTARQWQSLYEDGKEKIQKAITIATSDLEEELNDCILSLLSVPTLPNLKDGMEHKKADDTIQVDEPRLLTGNMEDDVEMDSLESGGDDDDSEIQSKSSAIRDHLANSSAISRTTSLQRRAGRPRNYTEADMDAMVIFLVDQGLTNGIAPLSYWLEFSKQNPHGRADAWYQRYLRHNADLTARAKELKAKRLLQQPSPDKDELVGKSSQMDMSKGMPDIKGDGDMKGLFGSSVDKDVQPDTGIDANGLTGSEAKESTSKELRRDLYDESEVNAMVEFLADHGLTDATESHWRQFRSEYSMGAERTSYSLRKFYGRNKSVLDTRVRDLRASREYQQGIFASTSAGHLGVPELEQQGSVPVLQEEAGTVMQGTGGDLFSSSVSSDDEGGDDNDDGDFHLHPAERGQRDMTTRICFTEEETKAMVEFLADQGLTGVSSYAGLSYWTTFCRLNPSRRNRTAISWRSRYLRHKSELTVCARALLATRVGGLGNEKVTQLEGGDTPDQGHMSSRPEGKQASTAGTHSTFRGESSPGLQKNEDNDAKSLFVSSADGNGDLEENLVVEQGGKNLFIKDRRFSKEEMKSMVVFLAEGGFTEASSRVMLADWRTFREKVSGRMSRTPESWQGQYGRHKAELTERARAMLVARKGQGQQHSQGTNVASTSATSGGDDDTGRFNYDEHGPLPPGWQQFRSVKHGGFPFYYDTVNKVSQWERPQF